MTTNGLSRDLPPEKLKNVYLSRYAWPGPIIKSDPEKELKMIVVIPCYHEPDLIRSLESLHNCVSPACKTEVIVIINHSLDEIDEIKAFNLQTAEKAENWIKSQDSDEISFHVIRAFDLQPKAAGVGLARKIGMDEAVRRFEQVGEKQGIIVCFDADCVCSDNYLQEIYRHYTAHPETNVALLHFEHPIHGELPQNVYEGIVDYEIHLRYYKNALKFAGFPFSYHTIGSCITVSSEAYQKQGGMNQRKAGEDFYFLQKIFPHGNIFNISSAIVIPSPRPSDRVPFGTGKAINDILSLSGTEYQTYNPLTFVDLKSLIDSIGAFYDSDDPESVTRRLSESVVNFLSEIQFSNALEKIKKNNNSKAAFLKSFYQWFNGFSVLKFVHFSRDHYYKNIEVLEASNWILKEMSVNPGEWRDKLTALELLRELDRSD